MACAASQFRSSKADLFSLPLGSLARPLAQLSPPGKRGRPPFH